jgi:shikimate dehydrogenase
MKNIIEYRKNLDIVDSEIAKLLKERMDIVKEIGIYKRENNLSTEDSNRENKIYENLESEIGEEYKKIIRPIYGEIFKESKKLIAKIKEDDFTFGLIGESLSHSKSSEIHELFGKYRYSLKNLKKDELPKFFSDRKFIGINVTIPYKEESMKYLDEVDDLAKEIGAVNTIVNRDGRLIGYNTDYFGFKYSLEHNGIDLKDKKVLILGSGGASKMVQKFAKDSQARKIVVISRKTKNNYESIDGFLDFNVIINATPVGMYPHNMESKIDLSIFKNLDAVIDLIYNPLETKLILDAKKLNIKTMSGLLMLVAQAFYACELFMADEFNDKLIDRVYNIIRRDMENIIFIGMPSSGKSTMGRLVSKNLNREFYDLDELVEKRENKTIPEIFKEHGEKYFRDLETEVLAEVSKKTGVVIATGGGTPIRDINRDLILQNSKVIYLDRKLENLETTGRPLSKNLEELKKLKGEREPIYSNLCDIKIEVIENKDETLNLIMKKLKPKKFLVIDGPNINMLGIREVNIYGRDTYKNLLDLIDKTAMEEDLEIEHFQSNHEGDIIDFIQNNYNKVDGVVINPAGYTHTSVAILDSLKGIDVPTVEVHISDVKSREDFRQISYVRNFAIKTFAGYGIDGYRRAIIFLKKYLEERE